MLKEFIIWNHMRMVLLPSTRGIIYTKNVDGFAIDVRFEDEKALNKAIEEGYVFWSDEEPINLRTLKELGFDVSEEDRTAMFELGNGDVAYLEYHRIEISKSAKGYSREFFWDQGKWVIVQEGYPDIEVPGMKELEDWYFERTGYFIRNDINF